MKNKIYTKWYHYFFTILILIVTYALGTIFGELLTYDWITVILTNFTEILSFVSLRILLNILNELDE